MASQRSLACTLLALRMVLSVACPANCETCDSPTYCMVCSLGFGLVDLGNDGNNGNTDRQCAPCGVSNCKDCGQNSNFCEVCKNDEDGKYKLDDDGACQKQCDAPTVANAAPGSGACSGKALIDSDSTCKPSCAPGYDTATVALFCNAAGSLEPPTFKCEPCANPCIDSADSCGAGAECSNGCCKAVTILSAAQKTPIRSIMCALALCLAWFM